MNPFEDHLAAPRGHGALDAPDGSGAAGGAPCGDLIRIDLAVEGDRIADARFDAEGCGAASAAGSAVVELVTGGLFLDAARVNARDISDELGNLSAGKFHAAALAADALHRALGVAAQAVLCAPVADRTLVAMSGGVDSAVAAELARERGDDVVAVTLELWADPDADTERSCCSSEAVGIARGLAHRMGMPHLTLDLRGPFGDTVVANFISEYEAGRTPNPCVRCNGMLRFDAMLDLAGRLGAARLATGHYARVERDADGARARRRPRRQQGPDLHARRVAARPVRSSLVPAGRAHEARGQGARPRGGPAGRGEAREPGPLFPRRGGRQGAFPQPAAAEDRAGDLVDTAGRVLGRHTGQRQFTVGQRRGLGISGPEPLFVVDKDPRTGRVSVGPRSALAAPREVRAANLHRQGDAVDHVKLRYRSRALAARIVGDGRPAGTPASSSNWRRPQKESLPVRLPR